MAVGGWLLAELALVLMLMAFGSSEGRPVARTAPVAAPTEPTEERGVLLTPVSFVIGVEPAGDGVATVAAFSQNLSLVVGPDRQVGLVLMFGVSRDAEPLHGSEVSRRLRDLVAGLPALASATDLRPYIGGSDDGQPGEVRVELFLLTN